MISLIDSEHALVDKICLRGFSITAIDDFERLFSEGIIRNNPTSPKHVQVPTIPYPAGTLTPPFTALHIGRNAFFDDLTFSVESGHTLSSIELSVRPPETTRHGCSVIDSEAPGKTHHNLNCQPIETVRHLLDATWINLCLRDGIDIDISNIRIYSIEINKTFALNSAFASYYRPICKLMSSFSGRLRLEQSIHYGHASPERQDVSSFYRQSKGKTGITVKLYDKTAQLKSKGITTAQEYARLEVTLKGYDKIDRRLGSNQLKKLSTATITASFEHFLDENLFSQLEKRTLEKHKIIRKTLQSFYQKGSKTWALTVLLKLYDLEIRGDIPTMLSLGELLSELDEIPFDSRQSKSDARRKLTDACEKISSIFLNRDSDRMNELITKLSAAS